MRHGVWRRRAYNCMKLMRMRESAREFWAKRWNRVMYAHVASSNTNISAAFVPSHNTHELPHV